MSTTTYAAIVNAIETTINGITPTSMPNVVFHRSMREEGLKEWALEDKPTSGITRAWELLRDGNAEKPPFQHFTQIDRTEGVLLTVAYYAPQLRGSQDHDDVEDVIREDASLIHDAIVSPGILVAGWNAAFVDDIPAPDRSDSKIWFQDIPIVLRYYESQSLT